MRTVDSIPLALLIATLTPGLAAQAEPDPIVLTVHSAPTDGVSSEMHGFDALGRSNGTTTFVRVFNNSSTYRLTAPLVHEDSNVWTFDHWMLQSTPGGSIAHLPIGQTTIGATTGNDDDTVTARYVAGCKISVQVTGPASHTTVACTPADVFGKGFGQAPLTLFYPRSTGTVEILAPASTTGVFKYWVLNGVRQPLFEVKASIDTRSSENISAVAVFGPLVLGGIRPFGSPCTGTAGQLEFVVPSNSSTFVGGDFIAALRNTPPLAAGWIVYGLDNTTLGGVPLPVQLPGTACDLLIDPEFTIARTANASGVMSHTLPIPAKLELTGTVLYAQWIVSDPGANALGLTTSEGMEITIAGSTL